MGWGDEAEAWLRSKIVEGSPGYQEELRKIQDEYGRYAQQHNILAPAAEFAGGVLPAVASYIAAAGSGGAAAPTAAATTARTAGALARLARGTRAAMSNPYVAGAVTGATQGGISGAGSAQEGNRTGGALTGAVMGTGFGLGVPMVIRGGGATANWLRERVAPSDQFITGRAAGKINEALDIAGLTPAQADQAVAADRAMGLRSTLADVSRPTVALAETVAQRGGKSADVVEGQLGPRTRGTKQRTYDRLKSDVSGKNYFADRENAVNDLRSKAKTVYDNAYFTPEGTARTVDNEKINYILTNPTFKDAYQRGKSIAEAEAMAAKLRGEDPERYVLPDIYESVPSGQVDSITNAPIMTEKLSGKPPTVRVLDYVKRGLDDMIDSSYQGTSSAGKGRATALKDLRNQFVKSIDENVPEYKQARADYAGDMEIRNAMDSGFNDFNRMAPEELQAFWKNATPTERDAFKSGAVRSLYDRILNTSRNTNAARDLIENEIMRKKLEPMFDSPAHFDLFKAALQRDAQLHENANRILQGSATARRTSARESFEQEPGVGAVMADAVTGGFGNTLTNLATRFMRAAKISEDKAAKVAELLMSSDPSEVAAAVQILEQQAEKAATKEAVVRAGEISTTGGLSSMAPLAPRPEEPEPEFETETAPSADLSGLSLDEALAAEEEAMNKGKKKIPGSSMIR
jgi:hypothetical protein